MAHEITKEELAPGDILNNRDGDGNPDQAHVLIFAGWANAEHTSYDAYEENPAWGGAHYTTNLPYPFWKADENGNPYSQSYTPMRYNGLTQSPSSDGSAPVAGNPTGGDGLSNSGGVGSGGSGGNSQQQAKPPPGQGIKQAKPQQQPPPPPVPVPAPAPQPPVQQEKPAPEEKQVAPKPHASLDVTSGPPGTAIKATGGGFLPNKPITVTESGPVGKRTVGTITSDGDGNFTMNMRVSDPTLPGRDTITFTQSGNAVSVHFTITSPDSSGSGQSCPNGMVGPGPDAQGHSGCYLPQTTTPGPSKKTTTPAPSGSSPSSDSTSPSFVCVVGPNGGCAG